MGDRYREIEFLRERAASARVSRPPLDVLSDPRSGAAALRLSRREAIQAAGAAAVGATLLARLLAEEPLGEVRLRASGRRAVLFAGGTQRWEIDVSRFGGAPRLSVREQRGRTYVALTGAFYPGTRIPAGFSCDFPSDGLGSVRLRHDLGAFFAEVPFAQWLNGSAEAISRIRLSRVVSQFGRGALTLCGAAGMTLGPDLAVTLSGRRVASLDALGEAMRADRVGLTVAPHGVPGLLDSRLGRRTLVTLSSRAAGYPLAPLAPAHAGRIEWVRGFEALTLETGESAAGRVHASLLAETLGDDLAARYFPAAARGRGLSLPLVHPRLAATLGPARPRVTLVADYAPEGAWVSHGAARIRLGGTSATPRFEMRGRTLRAEEVLASPALLDVSVPFTGAVAAPAKVALDPPSVVHLGTVRTARGVASRGYSRPSTVRAQFTLPPIPPPPPPITETRVYITSLELLRPKDLLALRFEFVNVDLVTNFGFSTLRRHDTTIPAYISAVFPGQNVYEQCVNATVVTPPAPPLRSMVAKPSRIAFRVPDSVIDAGIAYTAEALLDWREWTPSVTAAAKADAVPPVAIVPPGTGLGESVPETAIEAPFRLVVSPGTSGRWIHPTTAPAGSVVPLWHTRLGTKGPWLLPPTPGADIRAVWNRDQERSYLGTLYWPQSLLTADVTQPREAYLPPFEGTLGTVDRELLVNQTGKLHLAPVRAELLALSSLGAWMKVRGEWADQPLELWEHRTTGGRDQYAKVIKKGFLLPFGHRAVLFEMTERRFKKAPSGRKVAYLIKTIYVIVRERERTFTERNMPLTSVRLLTKETPPLTNSGTVFVPTTNEGPFKFQCEGTDLHGHVLTFEMPLMFVGSSVSSADMRAAAGRWISSAGATPPYDYANVPFRGQVVAFADGGADSPDQTEFETDRLTFLTAVEAANRDAPVTGFRGGVGGARIRLATAARFGDEDATADVRYAQVYLDHGFAPGTPEAPINPGELFLELVEPAAGPVALDAFAQAKAVSTGSAKTSGVAAPGFKISSITKKYGLSGGPSAMVAKGKVAIKEYIGTLPPAKDALVIGGFKLADVIFDHLDAGKGTYPEIKTEKLVGPDGVKYTRQIMNWCYWWETGEEKDQGNLGFITEPGDTYSALFTKFAYTTRADYAPMPPNAATPRRVTNEPCGKTSAMLYKPASAPTSLGYKIKHPSYTGFGWTAADVVKVEEMKLDGVTVNRELYQDLDYKLEVEARDTYIGVLSQRVFDPRYPRETQPKDAIDPNAAIRVTYCYMPIAPGFGGQAKIMNFKLKMFGVVSLWFYQLTVTLTEGRGPVVDAEIQDVEFLGPLAFLADLASAFPEGTKGGLHIKQLPTSVEINGHLAIPNKSVGVLSFANVAFHTRIKVFFIPDENGDKRIDAQFMVGSPEKPIDIGINGFAGSGYIALVMRGKEVQHVTVSIGFGCLWTIPTNGVIDGMVLIIGGIQMAYDAGQGKLQAGVWIRISGNVDTFLGIPASILIQATLDYVPGNKELADKSSDEYRNRFVGRVELHIKVETGIGQVPIDWTYDFTFGGTDPTFGDAMNAADWDTYCRAFAS